MSSLIVEGPDLCGKSTLCAALAVELGRLKPERGPPPVEHHGAELAGVGFSELRRLAAHPWKVIDRLHLSEVAYSAALGRRSGLTPLEALALTAWVEDGGGMVVLCLPDSRSMDRLLARRGRAEELADAVVRVVRDEYERELWWAPRIVTRLIRVPALPSSVAWPSRMAAELAREYVARLEDPLAFHDVDGRRPGPDAAD